MDSIRLYAKRVEEVEDALMLVREKQKENYNFLTPFFGILLMVTAIGILIFSYGKIIEQLNRTSRLLRQLRKLNHKLKNKNHQLEAYNKELDSLTFIASHDLKEPLRKILTYTTMVESAGYGQLPAESQGHFEKIKRAAVRMRNLLNDLLLYSHVNTGDRKYEPIDLNKVVQEVVVNLEDEIAETRAQVNSGSLPVVKGMPFQLKQLFENLISNSLKYRNEEHAPRITIDSDVVNRKEIHEKFAKGHNRYHRVHVRDNGLGFDPSYADKVFKLFHRLHAHTDKPGTGIGLAICKKIIENHQGFIKASSEVNKGTVIEIYLPVN
jgi:light-regulated signal transduction histidine kinase (bacteriophytochrome)